MKIEKKIKIFLYAWLPTTAYHENLMNLGHFFLENLLYKSKTLFSRFDKILPQNRNIDLRTYLIW